MSWATPLDGQTGTNEWAEPIFEFWAKLNISTKKKPTRFRATCPHVSTEWEIDYKRDHPMGYYREI